MRKRAPVNIKSAQMNTIGERLRAERSRLGMNQEEFAAIGGVKKRAQITYEQNERLPDAAYLQGLAAAGVDVLFVLLGQSSISATTADEMELLLGYRRLDDPRIKTAVLGMVHGMAPTQNPARNAYFHGNVGQVVQGDQNGAVSFSVGGKKNKNREED